MRKMLTATLTAAGLALAAPQAAMADGSQGDARNILPGIVGLALLGTLIDEGEKDREDRNTDAARTLLISQSAGDRRERHGDMRPIVERDQPYFRIVPVPRREHLGHDPDPRERHVRRDDRHDNDHWDHKWDKHDDRRDKNRWERKHTHDHDRHGSRARQPLHSHGKGRWAIWHRHPYGNGSHRHSRR